MRLPCRCLLCRCHRRSHDVLPSARARLLRAARAPQHGTRPTAMSLPLLSLLRTPYPGGAPANVATGVARLGAGALFISAIGQDQLGDDFMKLLQGERGHGGKRLAGHAGSSRHSALPPMPAGMAACGTGIPAAQPRRRAAPLQAAADLHVASLPLLIERGVDTSAVQRVQRPTRDILVVRKPCGDREFAGFGKARALLFSACSLLMRKGIWPCRRSAALAGPPPAAWCCGLLGCCCCSGCCCCAGSGATWPALAVCCPLPCAAPQRRPAGCVSAHELPAFAMLSCTVACAPDGPASPSCISVPQAQSHEYADCFLDPAALPLDQIKARLLNAWALICHGTPRLGLLALRRFRRAAGR